MQTRKCYADADANADANRIRTKNNMSPYHSVGDIIKSNFFRSAQFSDFDSIKDDSGIFLHQFL